jgi:hypothetical protein
MRISWEDAQRRQKFATAKCWDISEWGVKLALPEPVAAQSVVSVRSERFNFAGSGVVRHCVRFGASYLVGIEFSSRLKFPEDKSERGAATR